MEPVPDFEKQTDEASASICNPMVKDRKAVFAWTANEVIKNVDDPDVLAELRGLGSLPRSGACSRRLASNTARRR